MKIITIKGCHTQKEAYDNLIKQYCKPNMIGYGYILKQDLSYKGILDIQLIETRKRKKYKDCHEHVFKLEYKDFSFI